jgi:hypothetical protein
MSVDKVIVTKGSTAVLTSVTQPNVTITSQPPLQVTTATHGPKGDTGQIGPMPSGSIIATDITLTGNPISGASEFILSGSAGSSAFIIAMPDVPGDDIKFSVNAEGVTVLGAQATTPTPVEGGFYYLNGVFYLGDNL